MYELCTVADILSGKAEAHDNCQQLPQLSKVQVRSWTGLHKDHCKVKGTERSVRQRPYLT